MAYTVADHVVPRETGPSSIARLSGAAVIVVVVVDCSPAALALPVYVARAAVAVAASLNGPMSRGTRFHGNGLDTPGSAAGAVSGRNRRRRRFPETVKGRSHARIRTIYNNICVIILCFSFVFPPLSLFVSISVTLNLFLYLPTRCVCL